MSDASMLLKSFPCDAMQSRLLITHSEEMTKEIAIRVNLDRTK